MQDTTGYLAIKKHYGYNEFVYRKINGASFSPLRNLAYANDEESCEACHEGFLELHKNDDAVNNHGL